MAQNSGLPGMLAEGLSQASVHPARATVLVSRLLFSGRSDTQDQPRTARARAQDPLADARDKRFLDAHPRETRIRAMLVSHGELINSYAEMWTCEI